MAPRFLVVALDCGDPATGDRVRPRGQQRADREIGALPRFPAPRFNCQRASMRQVAHEERLVLPAGGVNTLLIDKIHNVS